jgi:ATP-binding cassette subfamily B protein
MIGAAATAAFLYTVMSYLSRLFWFFLEETFTLLLIRRRGELDLATHEDPAHNDLFNKINDNGVWRIQNFVDRQFYLLQNIIEVTIAAGILVVGKWWLFAIVLAGTLPELIVEVRYGSQVWTINNSRAETRRRFWDLDHHFRTVASLVELKLFQNTGNFYRRVTELFRDFRREEKKNERAKLGYQMATLTLSQAVTAFAAVYFITQVVHGNLLVGTLTFFLASMTDLRQSLSSLFSNLGRQYQDSLFVTDVFTMLDLPQALPRSTNPIKLAADKTPDIIFEDVSFTYPGATEPALQHVNLRIPAGTKLALVGANGAGKTTFVKLLCRFYDPTAGRITVDGVDLREIDLESWYHQLGALFQDYARYYFEVADAIAVGRTSIKPSSSRVEAAAVTSEADVFIGEWEKNYHQQLGKHFTDGKEPSVGQWQKLALARTFYRDARILILDEPTSSIDAEAEAKIFEKMEALPHDRTVFLISHRFATVRQANQICVIEDGTISELGTHDELVAKDGTYARLFKLQQKGYR